MSHRYSRDMSHPGFPLGEYFISSLHSFLQSSLLRHPTVSMDANRGVFRAASFLVIASVLYVLLTIQVTLTSGLPTAGPETFCGEGQVWDDTLRSCVSCAICLRFPDTPHCGLCPESPTSPDDLSASEVTQTTCTEGSVWDSFQNGCVSCEVCETHPDTPICTACSSQQDSPSCPKGLAWDPFLENCMSCTICETHPASYICQVCPTVQPTVTPDPTASPRSDDPGRVTIILAAVLAFLGVFVLVLAAFFTAKCVPARYRRCPQCCQKEHKGDETNNGKRIAQPTGQHDSGRSSLVSSRSNSDTCVMEPLKPQDNAV